MAIFAVILFPLFMTLITSLKTEVDAFTFPPKWIFKPILRNYTQIFVEYPFMSFISNSLLVAGSNTCLCLILGSLAAYGLARYKFRGADNLSFWILSLRMMPPVAAIIPVYIIMKNLRWLDTPWALIVIYLTFNLPFVVWMMKGFFEDIPREIEESALVDGCSELGIFSRIAVPLVAPGLAATAIIVFIFAWNEFLFALLLTATKAVTLPVGMLSYIRETGVRWGYMTASGIISLIPIIIFTSLSQRYLVKGLTLGALK